MDNSGSDSDTSSVSDDEEIEFEFEMVERWCEGSQSDEEDDVSDPEAEHSRFDATLPLSHEYLGDGMEELRGRTFHHDEELVSIPLVALPGIIIIPGQVVPLHLFHPQSVSMMTTLIGADRTFGVIYIRRSTSAQLQSNSSLAVHKVGTTVEIQSVKEENSHDVATLKIKAIGRQRFELISGSRRLDGVLYGKVRIVSEENATRVPRVWCSERHSATANDNTLQRGRTWATEQQVSVAMVTRWPAWVYRQYDPYYLMDCLMKELHSWSERMTLEHVPKEPVAFSHWITSYLPFNDAHKLELLQHDCATLRLRRQLELIRKFLTFGCAHCQNVVSEKQFVFSMSAVGPSAAYVNPGGFIHETITFSQASGLKLRGRPSPEHSWFPGYAWTIAECRRCMSHMGWRFTAVDSGLSPGKFWGLSRTHVVPLFDEGAVEPDAKYMDKVSLNMAGISLFL